MRVIEYRLPFAVLSRYWGEQNDGVDLTGDGIVDYDDLVLVHIINTS